MRRGGVIHLPPHLPTRLLHQLLRLERTARAGGAGFGMSGSAGGGARATRSAPAAQEVDIDIVMSGGEWRCAAAPVGGQRLDRERNTSIAFTLADPPMCPDEHGEN